MIVITAGEIVGFGLFAIFLIWFLIVSLKESIAQARCKHDEGVNETRACDAICRKCLKNLGFIGSPENTERRKKC